MWRLLLLFMSIFMTGCSSQLFDKPSYIEKITGYYGVEDKNLLIVTGESYSYVFNVDQQIINVLVQSRKTNFDYQYNTFKLNSENKIEGVMELIATNNDNKKTLEALGFLEDKKGKMTITIPLKGERYIVEGSFPFEQLEDKHFVTVEIPEANIAKIGKIIVTPVVVTIGAVGFIAIHSLIAFFSVMENIPPIPPHY